MCSQVDRGFANGTAGHWDLAICLKIMNLYKKFCKTESTSVSYQIVKMSIGYPILKGKTQSFIYVARLLRPFFEGFQKDAPMMAS